jgi:hypothetical protein
MKKKRTPTKQYRYEIRLDMDLIYVGNRQEAHGKWDELVRRHPQNKYKMRQAMYFSTREVD